MRLVLIFLALLTATPAAAADIISAKAEKVAIVIYPGTDPRTPSRDLFSGLAMVTEQRTVDLPAGPSKISFRGVAEGIVAQTVAVEGLPDKVKEQNFDYQLLSPGSLLRQSEGRQITLVRTNAATGRVTRERARVISSANGVMLEIAGRLEALDCSAAPEAVVFDDLPAGLIDKPTLSLDTVVPKAGRYKLTLSYIATGVSWAADYIARIRPDGKTLDLSAWITIGNRSSASFPNAPVQVLAGRVQRNYETRPVQAYPVRFNPSCWQINSGRYVEADEIDDMVFASGFMDKAGGLPPPPPPPPPPPMAAPAPRPADAAREDLGDYKLYSLPEPTTLAPYQTKQLTLFTRQGVAFQRLYRRELSNAYQRIPGPQPAIILARLENKAKSGLGLPLPAGNLTIFEPGRPGHMQLSGGGRVVDTPIDIPVEIQLGEAADVQVESVVTNTNRTGNTAGSRITIDVAVTITNAKAQPVVVQLRENNAGRNDFQVIASAMPWAPEHGRPQWLIAVPANGATQLTYRLGWTL